MINLKLKRLNTAATLPIKGSEHAACYDLYAAQDAFVSPDAPAVVHTGWAAECPPGYAIEIYSRSGHGRDIGVRLTNCVGIVDADFRGEICVMLTADADHCMRIRKGDRIAQFKLVAVPDLVIQEVDVLSETGRGAGGFGSSGR